MFETVDLAPADPILGLTEAFNADPRPDKINLGVGVYKDSQGKTPVLASVKEAERRLLDQENTKNYLPIDGDPVYDACVQELLFAGGDAASRCATAQCPGGTGALRVAADYLRAKHPGVTVWLSEPTWPNHPSIFEAAGLPVKTYPYFDPATNGLAFDRMLEGLRATGGAKAGDVVLLHGCCHNPTGVDPTPEQWAGIAGAVAKQGLLPLVDFAYQGFAEGLAPDAAGLRVIAQRVEELLVCSSFSKNFGLYNERVGALTIVAKTAAAAASVMSHVKVAIRRNYSNPPAHGGKIVAIVLKDAKLRQQWEREVGGMRDRINSMRMLLVQTLKNKGAARDFSFIQQQRGMFSFSGLTKQQVDALREKHAVYAVGSGRISVAGMTESNMEKLCDAIVDVLAT